MNRIEERFKRTVESMGLDYKHGESWDVMHVDSMEMVQLVMACEDEFGLDIPDEDIERLSSPAEAIRYLAGRMDL